MSDKFYDQARVTFTQLSPRPGDTITVSFPEDMAMQQIHSVVTYLAQLAEEFDCAIMVLGQGVDVNILNEDEMAQHGWMRITPTPTLQ